MGSIIIIAVLIIICVVGGIHDERRKSRMRATEVEKAPDDLDEILRIEDDLISKIAERNPTIVKVVQDYLKEKSYDGICNRKFNCYCLLDRACFRMAEECTACNFVLQIEAFLEIKRIHRGENVRTIMSNYFRHKSDSKGNQRGTSTKSM